MRGFSEICCIQCTYEISKTIFQNFYNKDNTSEFFSSDAVVVFLIQRYQHLILSNFTHKMFFMASNDIKYY